jgi:hypothetical protein
MHRPVVHMFFFFVSLFPFKMSFHFFYSYSQRLSSDRLYRVPTLLCSTRNSRGQNNQTVHLLQQETSGKRADIFTHCQFQFPSLQNTCCVPESLFCPNTQFVIYHLRLDVVPTLSHVMRNSRDHDTIIGQYNYLTYCIRSKCGTGSVVGIATGYGLDGPGIESRWDEIFRTCPDQP